MILWLSAMEKLLLDFELWEPASRLCPYACFRPALALFCWRLRASRMSASAFGFGMTFFKGT